MVLKVQMRDIIYSSEWDKEKNIYGKKKRRTSMDEEAWVVPHIVEVFNYIWSLTSSILKSLHFSFIKGEITHDVQLKNTLPGL